MKAVRWTLFCLLAFGLGTGVALAVNPPSPGIPDSTASALTADLEDVRQFAGEGRCDAVRGHIDSAQAKITNLPSDTNASLVRKLQSSLEQVSTSAMTACQEVVDANEAKDQAAKDAAAEAAKATTPTATPEPDPTPTPDTSGPDGSPGTDEGDGATTPSGGATTPSDGTGGSDGSSNGGVPVPEGATLGEALSAEAERLNQKIERARERWNDRMDKLRGGG